MTVMNIWPNIAFHLTGILLARLLHAGAS